MQIPPLWGLFVLLCFVWSNSKFAVRSGSAQAYLISLCFPLSCFPDGAFFTNWSQDPPPGNRLQLTLLWYLLYCHGLEPKAHYFWGMPAHRDPPCFISDIPIGNASYKTSTWAFVELFHIYHFIGTSLHRSLSTCYIKNLKFRKVVKVKGKTQVQFLPSQCPIPTVSLPPNTHQICPVAMCPTFITRTLLLGQASVIFNTQMYNLII